MISTRRTSLGAELLESRRLLNSHLPHHPVAHVTAEVSHSSTSSQAPHLISGTLTGIGPGSTNSFNVNQGVDTYSASTPAKSGTATYYGTDAFTSTVINSSTSHDTYFNGFAVLYLGHGNEVAINYVGSGPYPTQNVGPYSATFKGEAIGITGTLTGHIYSFNATLKGDATTSAVTLKISLKD